MSSNADRLALLRAAGFHVHVSHRRPCDPRSVPFPKWAAREITRVDRIAAGAVWAAKGGTTEVSIILDFDLGSPGSGPVEYVGTAMCSRRDNFNRGLGLHIALNRAETEMAAEGWRLVDGTWQR